MNENESPFKNLYEWIGRKVVRIALESGMLILMLMTVLALSLLLNEVINLYYVYPEGALLRLGATLLSGILFAVFLERELHEKIAAQVMEDSTITKREKIDTALVSGAIAIFVFLESLYHSDSLIYLIPYTLGSFFVFFLASYALICHIRKEGGKRTQEARKAARYNEMVNKICWEIKEIIPAMERDRVYYIQASGGIYRLSKDSKGKIYLTGGGNGEETQDIASKIKRELKIDLELWS